MSWHEQLHSIIMLLLLLDHGESVEEKNQMPMTDSAVKKVEEWAKKEKASAGWEFRNRKSEPNSAIMSMINNLWSQIQSIGKSLLSFQKCN